MSILTGIFGSRNERLLKQYGRSVTKISALEDQIQALDDDQLAAKTDEFRRRLEEGAKLDDLLIEAFACVREAARRAL
ncbi:MAG: hypothetical protein PVJ74_12790, partial [Gammaproteobacteria bacterium]